MWRSYRLIWICLQLMEIVFIVLVWARDSSKGAVIERLNSDDVVEYADEGFAEASAEVSKLEDVSVEVKASAMKFLNSADSLDRVDSPTAGLSIGEAANTTAKDDDEYKREAAILEALRESALAGEFIANSIRGALESSNHHSHMHMPIFIPLPLLSKMRNRASNQVRGKAESNVSIGKPLLTPPLAHPAYNTVTHSPGRSTRRFSGLRSRISGRMRISSWGRK